MTPHNPPILLGIDPGTRITGYGVIRHLSSHYEPIDFGCIRPPAHLPLQERYKVIFEALQQIIVRHKPTAIATETQFIMSRVQNVDSILKLGMAKGMVMLAAATYNIPLFEYSPTKAKKAVVGQGGASKLQVQKMIQQLLKLPTPPEPEDAADALALAICCAHQISQVNALQVH